MKKCILLFIAAVFVALTASGGKAENPSLATPSVDAPNTATPAPEVQGRPVSAWILDVVSDEPATKLKALKVLAEVPPESLKAGVNLIWEVANIDGERKVRLVAAKISLKTKGILPGDFFQLAIGGDTQVSALFLGSPEGFRMLVGAAWGQIYALQESILTFDQGQNLTPPGGRDKQQDARDALERIKAFLVKNMSPALAKALEEETQLQERQNEEDNNDSPRAFFKTLALFKALTAGSGGK